MFDAITAMAIGYVFDPGEARNRIQLLIDQCNTEAQGDNQHVGFPHFLRILVDGDPVRPAAWLIRDLDCCRDMWPTSAREVYRLAGELAEIDARTPSEQPNIRRAIGELHDGLFAGDVQLRAIEKHAKDRRHQPVDNAYFHRRRELLWRSNGIGRSDDVIARTYGHRTGRIPLREPEYDNVLVDRKSLVQWLKRRGYRVQVGSEPSGSSAASRAQIEIECRQWLVDQVAQSPDRRSRNRNDFKSEAMGKFPGLSGAAFGRLWGEVTRTNPAWRQAGRPKKS